MNRKIFAILLCVALTAALFGTLAVAAEENVAQPTPDTPTCTCNAEEGAPHAEDCDLYEKDEIKVEPPVCTCNAAEGDPHTEDCPCYVEQDETKDETKDETEEEVKEEPSECKCGAEDGNHAEDCPLYKTLFDRLMACKTLDAFCDLLESATEAEYSLLTEEQMEKLTAHLTALMPEPDPPVVIEENVEPDTVESDVELGQPVTPAVDYTNVAPII